MSGVLFGEPDEPAVQRVQSAKDRDDAANKIVWRRYKVSGVICHESINPHTPARCGPATWLRIHGPEEKALCSRHRQEYLEAEALNTPRGGQ